MSEPETYHGSCHCEAIKFTVKLPNGLDDNGTCDCSHCAKRGIIWQFPEAGDLELEGNTLKAYQFGAKSTAHQFCGECGTFILGCAYDPKKQMPFNASCRKAVTLLLLTIPFQVRALRGINIHEVPLKSYSGKDREPAYVPSTPLDHNLDVPEGKKVYHGSCHCHAVRFAVVHDPLEKSEASDCNCSLCGGNGTLWIYPQQTDFFMPSECRSNLGDYTFGAKENHHMFCKTCGINIYEQRENQDGMGVNIRLLEGCADELAKIKIKKVDGLNDM